MNMSTEKIENNNERTEVKEYGEFGLIDYLTGTFGLEQKSSIRGVGDDAAVIDYGDNLTLVSTDLLVEGVHFDLIYTPLPHLGYKAVIVNLSDIYAMNAIPRQITVSIAISNRISVEALNEFYTGIKLACERYGVDLVGGDTTTSVQGFTISITAIGEVTNGQQVYRNGAKPGDLICVSGDLGAAYMGLQLLEREKQVFLEAPESKPDLEGQDLIVGRFLKPEARKDIVEMLSEFNCKPNAMMDISDGLSSELHHISKQSEVGIKIFEEKLPIAEETSVMALKFNIDPMVCALNGGEDYELLCVTSPEEYKKLPENNGLTVIGEVLEEGAGINIISRSGKSHKLLAQGWHHV
jgi:thiamine-monophosphate kinase